MSQQLQRSRRALLAAGGALCLRAAFAATDWPQSLPRRTLVDVHHHWYSRDLIRTWGIQAPDPAWTVDHSVAAMDEAGVSTAILSIVAPGVWNAQDGDASVALARACNEGMAQTVRNHRGRFGFFAALALPMTAASIAEVGYSLDVLQADGVGLLSNYDGKYLGDELFASVFEQLNRRRAIVYVHPTVPACCRELLPGVAAGLLEEPVDTTRTIESLLLGGALTRWPDIRFICAHGGGTLPFVADRLLRGAAQAGAGDGHEVSGYDLRVALSRLYFDSAGVATPAAWSALMAFTSPERILFGSDYPYRSISAELGALKAMEQRSGLDRSDTQSIEFQNAQRLFPVRPG